MKRNKAESPVHTGKAALYIRVSTDAQRDEGYSVDAQKQMLEAYCVSRGIQDYEFYTDGGYTGSHTDRPELRRLISDAKNGKLGCVVVYKLDRLSRSQKDTLYLIEDVFNPNNVDFTSINEHMDTSTPMGRLMLGILSAFAQLERENIRERTRMGMKERVKSGLWMGGGRVPFGYDYDRENGILVPNADAETVKTIYRLYIQGYSLNHIAKITGLKYERLAYQVLTRKSNAGFICYNGNEYMGRHEPIISLETYHTAMDCLRERSVKRFKDSGHLLTGLVVCGRCGAKMRYQKWGKKGYKLVCYSRDKSKAHLVKNPDCDNAIVWADEIEQAVTSDLFSFCLEKQQPETAGPQQSVLELLHEQQRVMSVKLKRLYGLYAADGNDVLLEAIDEQRRGIDGISRQIEAETERNITGAKISGLKKEIERISDIWDVMSCPERQTLIRTLIDKITIDGESVHIAYVF
jgi:site-specific DNA recombinase